VKLLKNLRPIEREFYNRDTLKVAKDILGKILVRKTKKGYMTGRIVEVEAYKFGEYDKASHASKRCTLSNQAMFGENGHAYVYFTYGMYFMLNVVAKKNPNQGFIPLTYMWCAHTKKLSAPIPTIAQTIILYPKIFFLACTEITSDTIPKAGSATI